jgi:cytoskeletal protein CcmA (bactofilin family)
MWTSKQPRTDLPTRPTPPAPGSPVKSSNETFPSRMSGLKMHDVACLGPNLVVKAEISGSQDLQIDGVVEGPISLENHMLTVGRTAQLKSEVLAREVVVFGWLEGNLRVRERVEIRKDGSVIGDITTARISIEDGAYFKGRIEIDRANRSVAEGVETVADPVAGSPSEPQPVSKG